MTVDFDFIDNGTLTLVVPKNEAAESHLREHTDGLWFGGSLAVEPRYAPELSAALCRDGFTVELPNGRVVTAADLRE
jgi:hypothetical protein